MSINTSNQIYSQFEKTQDFLEKTDAIRMIGEYVYSYFAGKDLQEKTIRSTSQFVDIKQSMDARSLIYTPMAPEEFGKKVKVNREKTETSFEKLWTDKPVIHDRACSLFNTTPGQLFIISGTWSLVGIRLENPILEKESYEAGFSNEFTPEWNIDFLKNVPGMWFFQQLLDDQEILSNHIYQKHPTFIDPWHTLFSSHINMFSQICEYAKITHKIPPTSISEAINIVIQSLAKSYTQIVQSIEQITNNTNESIKIMGGGAKCNALNQLIADYSGKKVIIETIESSVIGNIAYQIQEKEGKQKANDFYTSQIDGTIFFPNRKHTNNNDK